MTYLSHTPPPKNSQKHKQESRPPDERQPYHPGDMGDDHGLSLPAQRDLLCHLHNRVAALSFTDGADSFYKLSNAICSVGKFYVSQTKPEKEENPDDAAEPSAPFGGISDAQFDDDIRALCDILNGLPNSAFRPGSPYNPQTTPGGASTAAMMAAVPSPQAPLENPKG